MKSNSNVKKDKWTEDEILALPSGENDKFDRKSGLFIYDGGFEESLAKALSAFSNSGGGHLIIGVADDGSFDGVDEIRKVRKGRQKTREWLEQKIPNLLTPTLQDFRVHKVEKSTLTQIPVDKVIIVIDVGDSNFAPHQSIKDTQYYYRTGGHSKNAPHQLLELLWKRETYPGAKIASAWLYTVINKLLYIFEAELSFLEKGRWKFDRFRPESLQDLVIILQKFSSGNFEQFFENYPEIYLLIETHDLQVNSFITNLEKYYEEIKNSSVIKMTFQHYSTLSELEKLKDSKFESWNYKIREFERSEQYLSEIFSTTDENKITATLAQYVINYIAELSSENTISPFWNVHYPAFLHIYRLDCPEKTFFEEEKNNLINSVKTLIILLKQERKFLSEKYGIPYEEPQQNFIALPQYGYLTY